MRSILLYIVLLTAGLAGNAQTEITEAELRTHIEFLTNAANAGRYPGEKSNKKLVTYLKKAFRSGGLKTEKQGFEAPLRSKKGQPKKAPVKTWNIIGYIEGSDPKLKDEYLILGAHYDHLGMGGGPSTKSDKIAIHHGADDNASGVAALLEIAEKIGANRTEFKRSILFIAFGAEEQGLVGSRYFVDNPTVPKEKIKLMLNMDMVGRLNDQKHVYMGGAGTFPGGVELMKDLGKQAQLNPIVHAGSVGGSDHVSFYRKNISVLGMHTGGHPQYHTPEDTIDRINFPGQKMVCDYIYNTLLAVANMPEIYFISQD